MTASASTLFALPADSLMNIAYGKEKTWKNTDQTLTMDIFFPQQEAGKKYPLVMLMHGGTFLTGGKEAMKGHCKILADSGFIAVAINYRKGWDRGKNPLQCDADIDSFKDAVYRATQDANTALRFLVTKQNDYAIDTAWIFVGGSSAGGVIALNLAYLDQKNADRLLPQVSKNLGKLNPATNPLAPKIGIKGICSMWGAVADSSLITKQNAVPAIFYHGKSDITVPYDVGRFGTICKDYPETYGSACVYRQTLAAGKPAILNISETGAHGPKEFYSKVVMSNTACFFKQIMQRTAQGGKIYNTAKAGCR